MIRKRYLIVLTVTIVSVLLGSLLYNNITLAQKGKEPTQVDVINLPVDEQGDLKIAIQPAFEVVNVTENQPFTVTVGQDPKLLCEANVEGWSKVAVYVYWSSQPSKPDFNGLVYKLYYRTSNVPSMRILSNVDDFDFRSGKQAVCLVWEVHGPILGVWVGSSGGTVGTVFTANVAVSLYLAR